MKEIADKRRGKERTPSLSRAVQAWLCLLHASIRKKWQSPGHYSSRSRSYEALVFTRPPCVCARYGGAYVPADAPDAEDSKVGIDAKCHGSCASVWDIYKKCEARIEEKVHERGAPP